MILGQGRFGVNLQVAGLHKKYLGSQLCVHCFEREWFLNQPIGLQNESIHLQPLSPLLYAQKKNASHAHACNVRSVLRDAVK